MIASLSPTGNAVYAACMALASDVITSDTHSAEFLAQRKRMHVIWGR